MVCIPTVCDYKIRIKLIGNKPEVVLFKGRSCRSKPYVCGLVYRLILDFERRQYLQKNSYAITTSGLCPTSWIFGRRQCRMEVVQMLCNPISALERCFHIYSSEVISTSGSVAMLTLTLENTLPIVALGRVAVLIYSRFF